MDLMVSVGSATNHWSFFAARSGNVRCRLGFADQQEAFCHPLSMLVPGCSSGNRRRPNFRVPTKELRGLEGTRQHASPRPAFTGVLLVEGDEIGNCARSRWFDVAVPHRVAAIGATAEPRFRDVEGGSEQANFVVPNGPRSVSARRRGKFDLCNAISSDERHTRQPLRWEESGAGCAAALRQLFLGEASAFPEPDEALSQVGQVHLVHRLETPPSSGNQRGICRR